MTAPPKDPVNAKCHVWDCPYWYSPLVCEKCGENYCTKCVRRNTANGLYTCYECDPVQTEIKEYMNLLDKIPTADASGNINATPLNKKTVVIDDTATINAKITEKFGPTCNSCGLAKAFYHLKNKDCLKYLKCSICNAAYCNSCSEIINCCDTRAYTELEDEKPKNIKDYLPNYHRPNMVANEDAISDSEFERDDLNREYNDDDDDNDDDDRYNNNNNNLPTTTNIAYAGNGLIQYNDNCHICKKNMIVYTSPGGFKKKEPTCIDCCFVDYNNQRNKKTFRA